MTADDQERRRLRAEQERLVKEEAAASKRLAAIQDSLDDATTKLNAVVARKERNMLTKFLSREEQARLGLKSTDADEKTPAGVISEDDQRAANARAIVRAGQKRRSEIPDDEPEPNTQAAAVLQLLRASRKARGLKED